MSETPVRRWRVNVDAVGAAPGVGTVALVAAQLSATRPTADRPVVALHDAMAGEKLPLAAEVDIDVPEYRGKSVIPVLASLAATRLAAPNATVSWSLTKRQGPDSLLRLLTGLGWRLTRAREAGRIVLRGTAPAPDAVEPPPDPAHFHTRLGTAELTFAADYGVFSPQDVDEGTRLLFDVVMRRAAPAASLADIGIGYGALAIGLVRNGIAPSAVATDVDCLSLLLARRNADAAGVPLSLVCSTDPGDAPDTELTVCNVPTHLDAAATAELMRALARRTQGGRGLYCVVHASLEQRYRRHLADHELQVESDPGPHHVVLAVNG